MGSVLCNAAIVCSLIYLTSAIYRACLVIHYDLDGYRAMLRRAERERAEIEKLHAQTRHRITVLRALYTPPSRN